MKRFVFSLLALLLSAAGASAQLKFVDAEQLGLVNKLGPTENRYHRVDTDKYDLTQAEANLLRMPAGMALVFRTNSSQIAVRTHYLNYSMVRHSTTGVSQTGYDLYIRKDGGWLYAGSNAPKNEDAELVLVRNMDDSEKECLLYLPLFSELGRIEIGIDEGARIEASANPFRYRIIIFGSSFTHGVSTSRAGMSYPMQIGRNTGLYFCSIACSGNCKLQPYFADYLGDVKDADAMVFDAFSNPDAKMIEERLIPFIERIRAKLPSTPLIFVQTIYRESGNFDLRSRKIEEDKRDMARRQMAEAMKRFDNVYFVDKADLTGTDHVTSADGTHPSDLGYWRWAQNLQPELLKVFRKCGIR